MRSILPPLLACAPDAMTALLFATAWIAPSALGPSRVGNLMLTMLIEFLVVHASGLSGGIALCDLGPRRRGGLWLLLAAVYLAFCFVFCLAFADIWPLFAFAWLLLGRFAHLWSRPIETSADARRQIGLWVGSGVSYVCLAIATAVIPLPAFGLTPAFVASLHLSGSGTWVERPQSVIGFGLSYFAVQAWIKYHLVRDDQPAPALQPRVPSI